LDRKTADMNGNV